MLKPKIVIEVSGGNVQNVFSTAAVDIVLVDHDNLAAEGKDSDEREWIMVQACKGMAHVF